MSIPLEISFHGMEPSEALRRNIRQHADHLARFADNILSCHVVIEAVQKRHHHGNLYLARIHVTLPGAHVDVGRARPEDKSHEDVYIAVRDAFNAARRQLEDFVRRRRGDVKQHSSPETGQIIAIDPDRGLGSIITADGREVTFHRNSVVDGDFERLVEGQVVRFTAVSDSEGMRASTVHAAAASHRHRQGAGIVNTSKD